MPWVKQEKLLTRDSVFFVRFRFPLEGLGAKHLGNRTCQTCRSYITLSSCHFKCLTHPWCKETVEHIKYAIKEGDQLISVSTYHHQDDVENVEYNDDGQRKRQ